MQNFDCKLNDPSTPPISSDLEQEAIGSVISERNVELEQSRQAQGFGGMLARPASRPHSCPRSTSPNMETIPHKGKNESVQTISFFI